MFPLVHIYAATRVTGKKTPLLVIGSILPDIVWVDKKTFPPEKLHDDIDDFYAYLESNQKDMLDLALGMKLHSNKIGADKYSHFYKGGYAYIKGKKLIPDLVKLVGQDKNKKIADLSHNFIEAALDLNLANVNKEPLKLYADSLKKVELNEIAKAVSKYLRVDYETVFKTIQILFGIINPKILASDRLIASETLPKFVKLSFGKDVDSEETLNILKKSVELTKFDYENLFDELISEMKNDFKT